MEGSIQKEIDVRGIISPVYRQKGDHYHLIHPTMKIIDPKTTTIAKFLIPTVIAIQERWNAMDAEK
jgi:hypothetical protein